MFPYNLYVRQQFQCEEVQWSLTCFTTQFLEQMVQRYIEGLKWEKGFDTLIFDVEDLTKKITNILKKD